MAEHGICDQCKDMSNPVTAQNGGTLSRTTGGRKTWVADVHKACKDSWLRANDGADFAGLEQTDRTLLVKVLAQVNGATDLKVFPRNLQLGNLELLFDNAEKLVRLRIHEGGRRARLYSVREPQEHLNA